MPRARIELALLSEPDFESGVSTSSTTPARGSSLADFRLADFRYELPAELIAQAPPAERAAGRLLVVRGAEREHRTVRDLPALLEPGDRLVFNDTRVVPARLFGRKASGGHLEFMLERFEPGGEALARIRSSKAPKPGARLVLEAAGPRSGGARRDDPAAGPASRAAAGDAELDVEVVRREGELFVLRSDPGDALAGFLDAHGEIPLPPYIERAPTAADAERYQTLLARAPGAVAAPTAGLHFDAPLLDALAARGIERSTVTLHVGAGTFAPVRVEDPARHVMHAERLVVDASTVAEIDATRAAGGRVVAVGTTAVRALETAASAAADRDGATGGATGAASRAPLAPYSGETRLFLTPGSPFRVVDAMVTNFHLPESTLLMLVAAFAGLDEVLAAYREAVERRYRFFSYGDAMLLFPGAPR